MYLFKYLLYPLSIIYFFVTFLKNYLYEINILKSTSFDLPIIGIGNLSFGGTGKTPMSEYIIENFNKSFELAFLSRGYKRSTNGFILASENSTVEQIGDEPFQILKKFKNIKVGVDVDRSNGVKKLIKEFPKIDGIILDDVFQHRSIDLKLSILLTTYRKPFYTDHIAPVGTLRESSSESKRADIIIVTKCPVDLKEESKIKIAQKIKLNNNQDLFFSSIHYDDKLLGRDQIDIGQILKRKVLLITGIADSTQIVEHLKRKKIIFSHISFGDHHFYDRSDYERISNEFKNYLILTTEKDFYKISKLGLKNDIYYLRIKIKFLDSENRFKRIVERNLTN